MLARRHTRSLIALGSLTLLVMAVNALLSSRREVGATTVGCFFSRSSKTYIEGSGWFIQQPNGDVSFKLQVIGISEGLHGVIVHVFDNITESCEGVGPHFNPFGVRHGGADSSRERHAGDLGNVESFGVRTVANLYIEKAPVTLHGPNGIVGRSLVIHEGEDDLGLSDKRSSLRTGHAGDKIACCAIRNV